MKKVLKQLLASFVFLAGCTAGQRQSDIRHWAVYYDDKLPASHFAGQDLVVFDRRYHPPLEPLKGNTILLGYVSIGEVHDDAPEKKILEKQGAILFQNTHWGSHAVDVTEPQWKKMVLDQVDDALSQGFDGVMLDTIDSPIHWAKTEEPERVEAMENAAVSLIGAIRTAHPDIKIMMNRGFDILPRVARDLDYALAESILTKTDDSTGQFTLIPSVTYAKAAAQLRQVIALAPKIRIFTLDYWNLDDVEGIKRIYALQRAQGFAPYVTTPDLADFTPEPLELRPNH